MPKKKSTPKPSLVPKVIQWPQDWLDKIDSIRGEVSFSDFVRGIVLESIGSKGLTVVSAWGGDRKSEEERASK